jgi:hypothetical protein
MLVMSLAACGGTTASPSPTATLIAVLTTPPPSPQACMSALLTGVLVADERWGIAVEDGAGRVVKVIWPSGYAARQDGTRLVLIDTEHGDAVVAREGDLVGVGGGFAGDEEDGWLACPTDIKIVAPS